MYIETSDLRFSPRSIFVFSSEIMYLIIKLKNKGKIVIGQSLEKFKDAKLYKTRITLYRYIKYP